MFLDLLRQEMGQEKTAAGEIRFCCPFCHEDKYKFYVEEVEGLWMCQKCSEAGNPVSFVKLYYNVNYKEAVDILATFDYDVKLKRHTNFSTAQYGSDLTEEERLLLFISRQGRPLEEKKTTAYTCPAPPTNCKQLVHNFDNPEAFPFFAYLHGRGVSLEMIYRHNISYVTRGTITRVDGTTMTLINHLVFFSYDDKGQPLYWNTRAIDKSASIKSFNAPSKENEYSKNNVVFNLNWANNTDKIVVTEGFFDAITIPGDSGVATFGKQVTDQQVEEILNKTRHNKLPIYLYLDRDAWVQMIKSAQRFKSKDPNREIYFVMGDKEKDANDLGPEKVQELIDQAFPANSEGELKLRLANL